MLLPPDGASFMQEGLVGYGWLATPFGKTSAGDGRNFWTLVFDTENFSGPALYILPEFFAQREPGQSVPPIPDLGTCKALQMGPQASEVQMVPTFKAATGEWRLPRMRFPQAARGGSRGRTVLSMGHRAYHRADVADKLEAAIASGNSNYANTLMVQGVSSRPQCSDGSRPPCIADAAFTVNAGEQKTYKMGVFNTSMVGEDVVWSLQHDGCGAGEDFCW